MSGRQALDVAFLSLYLLSQDMIEQLLTFLRQKLINHCFYRTENANPLVATRHDELDAYFMVFIHLAATVI